YASEWYNGPWELVPPEAVPPFILRVPVRYYRRAPSYFHAWSASAPPRWGEHWGHTWEERRRGWDQWNRSAVPAAAPLPTYQRRRRNLQVRKAGPWTRPVNRSPSKRASRHDNSNRSSGKPSRHSRGKVDSRNNSSAPSSSRRSRDKVDSRNNSSAPSNSRRSN